MLRVPSVFVRSGELPVHHRCSRSRSRVPLPFPVLSTLTHRTSLNRTSVTVSDSWITYFARAYESKGTGLEDGHFFRNRRRNETNLLAINPLRTAHLSDRMIDKTDSSISVARDQRSFVWRLDRKGPSTKCKGLKGVDARLSRSSAFSLAMRNHGR